MNQETNLEREIEGGEFITPSNRETAHAPFGYRLLRALLRIGFGLALRKIRLLYSEARVTSGPAIFFVHHPASLIDALLLVATFEERVHCLLEASLLTGIARRLIARGLDMIRLETEGDGWDRTVTACCELLLKRGIVVAFAGARAEARRATPHEIERIANLAAEAESRNAGLPRVSLSPVYLFAPFEHSQSRETLIFLGEPVSIEPLPPQPGSGLADMARARAAALEKASKDNAFRLHDTDLKQFLRDLEEVLRYDLQEEWAAKENWKQQVEGFVLSQKVAEWAELLNNLHPGRLVALREEIETYRERQRRNALATLEIEGMPKLKSAAYRAVVWAESILGFPVALYGLLNHALIWLVLLSTGLLKKDGDRDKALGWVGRILVALAFYSSQILLCDHLLGRAAAGYYAPSLPLTALYLWRYRWLLRHRARLVFLRSRLSPRSKTNQQMRTKLIEKISEGTGTYAGIWEASA